MSAPVFLRDWSSLAGMAKDFEIEGLPHIDVVLASYTSDGYEGSAFVLFYDHDKQGYFEVHGGHCSCYGLEGQWEPEPCSYASLMHRLDSGELGQTGYDPAENVFAEELRAALKSQPGHRLLRWVNESREVAP